MPDYIKLIALFDECIGHYTELLSFENEKLSYILTNNIAELGNCLSREQALIMKGNSLETRRNKLLEKEGIEGQKYQEIIEGAPDEMKSVLDNRYRELSKYVLQCKHINEEALDIVKRRLQIIEEKTSAPQTYDTKGERKFSTDESVSLRKNI